MNELKPITRKEKILSGDGLKPITREEMFLKKVAENGGGSGGGMGGADWNAAEGEPGHVLNRTHYTYTATFIPEAELQLGDDGEFVVETAEVFEAGKTYTIYWNGIAYNCTAVTITAEDGTAEGDTVVVSGNMAAVGGDDTGEPFCVAYMPGMLVIMPMDETVTTVTLRVDGVKVEKIPVEYIPNQNVIISIDEFLDGDYGGTHKISLDTTDLWYAFKNGYPVCVKVGGKAMHYAVQIQTITVIDESLLDYYGVANIPFTLYVYDIFNNKRHMILINTSD